MATIKDLKDLYFDICDIENKVARLRADCGDIYPNDTFMQARLSILEHILGETKKEIDPTLEGL